MSRAREAVRRMRRDLHRDRAVPALYLLTRQAQPVACTVRVHDRTEVVGQPNGSAFAGAAQLTEQAPRLIFIADDAPPEIRRNAIVSVEPGEAYTILKILPPHDITTTVEVSRLSATDADNLPVPSDA